MKRPLDWIIRNINKLGSYLRSGVGQIVLHTIVEQLDRSSDNPSEMPHRIELCNRALALANQKDDAKLWAYIHHQMAYSLARTPQGVQSENREQAIVHYQKSLTVYTPKDTPKSWALTHYNLAHAYFDRTCGERAEDLDQAIAHYQEALTGWTREANPDRWAATQNNLGMAYVERIRGDKGINLEQAISHYQQALQVWTCEAYPEDWVLVQRNLGVAYVERIHGERAENLEQALQYSQQALTVCTHEADPKGWAAIMLNLAETYRVRIRGERAESLEQTIQYAQRALTVYTREGDPEGWTAAQNNLGLTYSERIQGERETNLEQAITHCQQALLVETRDSNPHRWAMIQNNLGLTHYGRIQGEREANLEQAIAHFQQALHVWTRDANPHRWAMVQNNLGLTYSERIQGEREANLEQAVAHYQQALQVWTRGANPDGWATIQNNLGLTYSERIQGEREANWEQAITHFHQALQVHTLQHFPTSFQRCQQNLGHLHFVEGAWAAALEAYQEVIRAEQMLLDGAYTEAGRQAEVAQTAELYARMAYALLKVGRPEEALMRLEQGKARLLSRTLALAEVNVNALSGPQLKSLRVLRQTIRELEYEMRLPPTTPERRDQRVIATALNEARTALSDMIAQIRATRPEFMPAELRLSEILGIIPPDAALVAPLVTSQGSATFVVPAGLTSVSMGQVLWLNDFDESTLSCIFVGNQDTNKADQGGWLGAYVNAHRNLPAWRSAIESTGQALWEKVLAFIAAHLSMLQVNQILLMLPGKLSLLPMQAAWYEIDGVRRYFLDDYTITYLPSAYAYKVSVERSQDLKRQGHSLFAVSNPTENLPFAGAEGDQVKSLFDSDKVTDLRGPEATAEVVLRELSASYVHFACHGFYNWEDPLQSCLFLANGAPLTLGKIIGQLNLESTRLVTLSACETGITNILQTPDEYLGLPAGFLQAGTPSVVSTRWAVNDLSTMLLMERFYELHLKENLGIPEALRQAQIWLRDVSAGELAQRFAAEEKARLNSRQVPISFISYYFSHFEVQDPKVRPFVHPYYWAPFTFSGA